jgi:hypothetical protein
LDCSPLQETVLVLVDNFPNNFLQSISKELSDKFEHTIKKSDRPILIDILWRAHFGNKSNMTHIDTFQIQIAFIKIKAQLINVFFDKMPVDFQELAIKAIWPWSFINWQSFNY